MTADTSAHSATRARIAFALGCLFFAYAFVQRVSPSVMANDLMRDFSVGAAALGVLSATYLYPYALAQVPVGLLMDRFGPRPLLVITATVCAAASFAFATAETLLGASVARSVIGVSVAFAFVGTLTIASTLFPRSRFALLSGILFTIGMAGAVAGQVPLRLLVEQLNWRGTYLVLASGAVVIAILVFFFVPSRQRGPDTPTASIRSGLGAVCSNRENWLCALAGFGMSAAMLSFSGLWAVPWMTMTLNFDTRVAAGISSLIFVGWGLSAPALGWLSDRLGVRKPILMSGALLALITMALITYGRITSPTILAVLFFLHGAGACAMLVCFSLCRDNNADHHAATAISLINMFIVLSGAIMQPVVGALLDYRWDGARIAGVPVYSREAFDIALSALLVAQCVAVICAVCVRDSHRKHTN